ncbi:phage tail protein [Caballeronia sp. LZ035]|nr:phage tail protein [Caballeronia sp. LZ035]
MNETSVDRYGLYEIAKYCDQSVPNGDGGTEPRFSCNCHITSRTHAFALLQQLASVFRGIVYWSAGTVLSSADMPSDPVYVYNPTNVVNGIFKYTGSSLKSRYTAVAVTWCNPHNGYKGAVETVEDAEGIALYGHNAAEITTFGCTSRSQAQRAGHWLLQTSKCETETVTFGVGLDGVLALPGQVIEVADPLRSPLPVGGRIVDIDASGRVVLDREVRAQRGDYITLMMPDAKAHRVEISEASGTAVTLSVPLAQRPVRGAAWTLKSSGVATRLFRVVSVSEMTEGTAFSISAATHRPEKFAAVDNAATSNVIYDRYVPVDSPRNLQIQAVQGPNMEMAARVSWDLVKDAQQYNLEVSGPKGRREVVVVKSPDREVVFSDIQPGAYAAKVTAQAWDGRLSVIAHTEAVLAGLVYVEGFWSETISDRSVLLFEVKNAWDVPDWFIELRLSETENFDQSTETILGRTRDTFISIDRRRKGFAWARARYGKGECSLFSASAWYPSETGAGEPFGKD